MSRKRSITPDQNRGLSEAERAAAIQVSRRLRAELTAILRELPEHEQTAAGLERVLGMHRAVAHRLIAAITGAGDDMGVLMRIPGVEGLRQYVSRARERLEVSSPAMFAGADAAIDAYRDLIHRMGGSQAKLVSRLRLPADTMGLPVPRGRREDLRRAMYETVSALSGRSINVRSGISILRPNPALPDDVEVAMARSYIGHRASSGTAPLMVASHVRLDAADHQTKPISHYQTLAGEQLRGDPKEGLIEEFCSHPLPIATARDTTGRLFQVVDTSDQPGVPFDVTLGVRIPSMGAHPARQEVPIHLEVIHIWNPIEHLITDTYLHRSLVTGCTPSLSLLMSRGEDRFDLLDRWYDRIEGAPVLGLLGRGIGNAHSNGWSRHAELTHYMFASLGWNPEEFYGFRCEETYPLWGCEYIMSFDYRQDQSNAAPRQAVTRHD